MALSANTVWEVRTTGSDNNGGGFVAGTGTDYSQQNAAQWSGTNLEIHASTTTDVRPASGHTPTSADVGNLVQITAGTNFTTGFYQIMSIQSGYWRLDRAAGTAGSTGGTAAMGGALASPGKCGSGAVNWNTIYIKSGSYTITSASANVSGGCLGNGTIQNLLIVGYSTNRHLWNTDTMPVLTASGISGFTMISTNGLGRMYNLELDGGGLTSSKGTYKQNAIRCVFKRFTNGCIENADYATYCVFTGCSTATACQVYALFCEAHANTVTPFNNLCVGCLSYGNTGASTDGFLIVNMPAVNCIAYGNGGDGFDANSGNCGQLINCIAVGNSGVGYRLSTTSPLRSVINCAAYNNTSGNWSVTLSSYPHLALGAIDLTAAPFTDAGNGDFSLNSTSGGGASCRAAGFPSSYLRGLTDSYADIGAAQHQDSGGGTTTIIGGAWQ